MIGCDGDDLFAGGHSLVRPSGDAEVRLLCIGKETEADTRRNELSFHRPPVWLRL